MIATHQNSHPQFTSGDDYDLRSNSRVEHLINNPTTILRVALHCMSGTQFFAHFPDDRGRLRQQ